MTAFRFFEPAYPQMPELRTPRLVLRPLRMQDAPDVFRYSSDPAVSRHVLWDTHRSIQDTRAYLRYLIRQYRDGETGTWGVVLADTGRVIGTIGFMWINREHQSAEVGYSLARDMWNQGYTSEALRAVIAFGFDTLHVNRIEAQHETDNPASGCVMRNAGMRFEGTLRQRIRNKGRYTDVALYAILRGDARSPVTAPHISRKDDAHVSL